MNFRFNLRRKMGGVILEVEQIDGPAFINRFYPYAEFDKLHSDNIQHKLLQLQEELENEIKP